MANTGRGRVKRPDDKRLAKNLPASRRAAPKPKSRLQQLIDGEITVDDLDDEEIKRRRPRNLQGNFNGPGPKMLPRILLNSMDVEFRRRIQSKLDEHADEAVAALRDVANNKQAQAQARVNAAAIMLDRAIGKVPDQLVQEVRVREFEDFEGILVDVSDDELAKRRERRKNA